MVSVGWYHEDELSATTTTIPPPAAYQHRMARTIQADHVWTVSPTTILDLRANLARYEEPNNDKGVGFDTASLGFPSSFTSQQAVGAFPRIEGLFSTIGVGQAGSVVDTSYYTFAGTLTKVTGNMTWKVGAEHWVLQQANKGIGTQGVFTFDNSNWTRQNALNGGGTGVGSNAASFLLGLPNSGSFPRNADAFWSQHFEAFYVQNDWRVTPRLTINMGLRYDWETPVTERFNRMTTVFDPTVVNPMSDAAQAAYTNILNSPANANNAGIQILKQYLPASSFKLMGAQMFAGVSGQSRGIYQHRLDADPAARRIRLQARAEHRNPRRRRALQPGILRYRRTERLQPQHHPECHQRQLLHALRHARQPLPQRHPGPDRLFAGRADQPRPGRHLELPGPAPFLFLGVQPPPAAPDQELAVRTRLHPQQDLQHHAGPEPEPAAATICGRSTSASRASSMQPAVRWTRCSGIRSCRIPSRACPT